MLTPWEDPAIEVLILRLSLEENQPTVHQTLNLLMLKARAASIHHRILLIPVVPELAAGEEVRGRFQSR